MFFSGLSLVTDVTGGHELSKTTGNAGGRVGCGNHLSNYLRLCLVPRKYKGKKKNVKENDFLMFGCPMKISKKIKYN